VTAHSAHAVEDEAWWFGPQHLTKPRPLGPNPTAADWEEREDRKAPWAYLEPFEPIINLFPEGTCEHDDSHETGCFLHAFARPPNAPRKE
jgi:hypothetical protein